MRTKDLFKGVVILIDDEIGDLTANVQKLIRQIKRNHYPLVMYKEIPSDEEISNFGSIAFLVLDWELNTTDDFDVTTGVRGPTNLREGRIQENIAFIKTIRSKFFMPIFIFTNSEIGTVTDRLAEAEIDVNSASGTVFIKSKNQVSKGLLTPIKATLKKSPSLYCLKAWDVTYADAKAKLFRDFHVLHPKWPKVMWETYKSDSVPPSNELGKLITSNLLARMQPFKFQENVLDGRSPKVSKEHLIKLLESERYLTKGSFDPDLIAPGDIFKISGDYYVNIKSECDCVIRGNVGLELYLLKGSKVSNFKKIFDGDYGKFNERDNEFVIFPIIDGKCMSFQFKKIHIRDWSIIRDQRVGRIVAPYITKLQQKYAAYLQRQGLQRLPKKAV